MPIEVKYEMPAYTSNEPKIFDVFIYKIRRPVKGETVTAKVWDKNKCILTYTKENGEIEQKYILTEEYKFTPQEFVDEFNKQLNSK